MVNSKTPKEYFLKMERICLKQAELCKFKDSSDALKVMAQNYRAAATGERQAAQRRPGLAGENRKLN